MTSFSSWTSCRTPRPASHTRLVCFPYAGGNAAVYRSWEALLPPAVELHLVQLPGRMPRLNEAAFTSISSLVAALVPHLRRVVAGKPYALFGHSMGAIVAFEVARSLRDHGQPPARLFAAARQAPQLPWRRPHLHTANDGDFLKALERLGGTPAAVLADAELMALAMPALRGDFTAVETYACRPGPKLACPISVFGGADDQNVTQADLLAWQEQTTAPLSLQMVPGGHFFLETQAERVLKTISQDLAHA